MHIMNNVNVQLMDIFSEADNNMICVLKIQLTNCVRHVWKTKNMILNTL